MKQLFGEQCLHPSAKAYDEAIKVINNIRVYPNSKDFIKL